MSSAQPSGSNSGEPELIGSDADFSTRFVPVDFQPEPLLDLFADKALQPGGDFLAEDDKIVSVPTARYFC
jgi:hypothetical protein